MGQFLVAKFPSRSAAHQASIALDKLHGRGATVHAWAVVCKNLEGWISVSERSQYQGKPAIIAALIGGLAGFSAGPVGAITGAVGGALVGIAADSVELQAHSDLLNTISQEIGRNSTVLIAEIAPTDTGSFEALITHCGGTILDSSIPAALSLPPR